jgi:hypothetical protein
MKQPWFISVHSWRDVRILNSEWDHADHVVPLYPQKLALTSPTSGGRSVCIVRSWTQVTELLVRSLEGVLRHNKA